MAGRQQVPSHRWWTLPAIAVFAVLATAGGADGRGCPTNFPIAHNAMGTANGGGFIIAERAGETPMGCPCGPRMRFWVHGNYATFNQGSQNQWDPERPWLPNLLGRHGVGGDPDLFVVEQANWSGPAVHGCPERAESTRLVVEISFPVAPATPSHHTVYLLGSVKYNPTTGSGGFNLDDIRGGDGGLGNVLKASPIPVPQPAGQATVNPSDGDWVDVTLTLPPAKSYGDAGAPPLVAGYEIFYKNDTVPVGGFAADYSAVHDPRRPSSPLGMVANGTPTVKVAVQRPERESYFVTRLVYADPSRLTSRGVSGHSAAVAAPATGDEPDAEEIDELAEGDAPAADDEPVESTDAEAGAEATEGDASASGRSRSDRDDAAAAPADEAAGGEAVDTSAGSAAPTAAAGGADVSLPARRSSAGPANRGRPRRGDNVEVIRGDDDAEAAGDERPRGEGRPARGSVTAPAPGEAGAAGSEPGANAPGARADAVTGAAGAGPGVAPPATADAASANAPGAGPAGAAGGAGTAAAAPAAAAATSDEQPGADGAGLDGAEALAAAEAAGVRPGDTAPLSGSEAAGGDAGRWNLWNLLDISVLLAIATLTLIVLRGRSVVG